MQLASSRPFIQRLNILYAMLKLISPKIDFVFGNGIKHKRIVRIGRMPESKGLRAAPTVHRRRFFPKVQQSNVRARAQVTLLKTKQPPRVTARRLILVSQRDADFSNSGSSESLIDFLPIGASA